MKNDFIENSKKKLILILLYFKYTARIQELHYVKKSVIMREKNAKISDVKRNRWNEKVLSKKTVSAKSKYLLQNMIYV